MAVSDAAAARQRHISQTNHIRRPVCAARWTAAVAGRLSLTVPWWCAGAGAVDRARLPPASNSAAARLTGRRERCRRLDSARAVDSAGRDLGQSGRQGQRQTRSRAGHRPRALDGDRPPDSAQEVTTARAGLAWNAGSRRYGGETARQLR